MAVARLVASTNSVSSGVSVSNASNAYKNTDTSSSYATFQTTSSGTSNRYCYLRGFNFDAIPTGAVVSSYSVKIRGYASGINTSAAYAPCLVNGTTQLMDLASSNFGTSASVITVPISDFEGTLPWSELVSYGSNLGIRFNARRSSRNTTSYVYISGAEIEVNYSTETIHPTSVSLDKSTLSLEEAETYQLTETVLPANATDKSVSWSSSNTSVATVNSSGLVTAVSAGSATITVTTTDGGKIASCVVTVTQPTYTEYTLTTTLTAGNQYLIANGNSGSVYLVSNEANGSATLKGISATVSNNKILVTSSVISKASFECDLEDQNNANSTRLKNGSQYLYTDSSNGLRMFTLTSSANGKHWHYKADGKNLLWFFKDGEGNDGYTDTSSTYKYYLTVSSGNYTDAHVSTTSLANTSTPAIYLFTPSSSQTDSLLFKENGSWVQTTKAYKKINGSWVEQNDLTNVFQSGTNYIKGN